MERRIYWFEHIKPKRGTVHTHTHIYIRKNSVKMCSKFDCQVVVWHSWTLHNNTKQLCCILIDVFSQSESSASIVMTFSFSLHFTCASHYSFQVCSHCRTEFVIALHSVAWRIYGVFLLAFHVCKVRFTVANHCRHSIVFVQAVDYKERTTTKKTSLQKCLRLCYMTCEFFRTSRRL